MESVEPGSGQYSLKADLKLNVWLLIAVAMHLTQRGVVEANAEWGTTAKLLLTLSPLLPGLLYVRSWVRFVGGLDELQRRIQMEAFLFAAVGTVVVGAVVSVCNEHSISTRWMTHGMGLGSSFMVMLLLWSVGWGMAKCRYK